MKRILVICLFQLVTAPFLSSQSNPAKQIGGWVITPRHETYPVNHSARATLISNSNSSISLILDAKFQAAGNRPQDEGKGMVLLSILMESDGDHFQANVQRAADGVPVSMSFDDGKPIATSWAGGDALIEYWSNPCGSRLSRGACVDLTTMELLAKLHEGKRLTISYPIRDSGAHKSATFDLSGINDAIASICPAAGCSFVR